jgi:hypothetical protein
MFFPDKVQGYREARRVLKRGGHFLFNVWDTISENEFADVVTQALATLFPHDPPRFMARIPHGYHDVETIRAELTAAGFAEFQSRPSMARAAPPRRAILPSPTVKELRCGNSAKAAEETLRVVRVSSRTPRRAPSHALGAGPHDDPAS